MAIDQYLAQPLAIRTEIDARLHNLLGEPEDRAGYDSVTDTYSCTYANGAGVLVYGAVPDHHTLIVLRIVTLV